MLQMIPDKPMLKAQYWIKSGRRLNLSDPQRYTEKMQWYKLYYRDPAMQVCADKYLVREYVKEKGLGHLLNELYAVFTSPEDIRLEGLPRQFVLKLSNGSGTNLICKDIHTLDIEEVRQKFRAYTSQANARAGREWVYENEKPAVIVAEEYLEDPSSPLGSLRDYKILCFNGKPEYIICVDGRHTENYCHVVYDCDWNKQDVVIGESSAAADYDRPDTLDEMLEIARILSAGFPAARIDLYSIQNRIYFGEITFFPWSGYMRFSPDSFDYELGSKFVLPRETADTLT